MKSKPTDIHLIYPVHSPQQPQYTMYASTSSTWHHITKNFMVVCPYTSFTHTSTTSHLFPELVLFALSAPLLPYYPTQHFWEQKDLFHLLGRIWTPDHPTNPQIGHNPNPVHFLQTHQACDLHHLSTAPCIHYPSPYLAPFILPLCSHKCQYQKVSLLTDNLEWIKGRVGC